MSKKPNGSRGYDKKIIYDSYFDFTKLIIRIPPDELLDRISKNPQEEEKLSHLLHEFHHYAYAIGTPVCIFETLLRITCLVQTSYFIYLTPPKQKLKLPFCNNMEKYTDIAYSYNVSRSIHSYFFGKNISSDLLGIQHITGIKLNNELSSELSHLTKQEIKRTSPVFFLSFDNDGEKTYGYMPIGILTITEGFSRLIQDTFLKKYLPEDVHITKVAERLSNGDYLPYYMLWEYTRIKTEGMNSQEQNIIVLLSLYLSLMYIYPISEGEFPSFLDIEFRPSEQNAFLSDLSHPGETFFVVFNVLKEIVEERGTIENKEKEILNLINEACMRLEIPSLDELYDAFISFLERIMDDFYPIDFRTYPFAKHYLKVSLEFLKKAKENPYDFIFVPSEIAQKTDIPIIPPTFKGEYTNETAPEKNDWLLFSNVMEQFFNEKRIFCSHKKLYGTNWHCKNDKECTLDKVDYPYAKCEKAFIDLLNYFLGDINKIS